MGLAVAFLAQDDVEDGGGLEQPGEAAGTMVAWIEIALIGPHVLGYTRHESPAIFLGDIGMGAQQLGLQPQRIERRGRDGGAGCMASPRLPLLQLPFRRSAVG
jgi:hypothetical protein